MLIYWHNCSGILQTSFCRTPLKQVSATMYTNPWQVLYQHFCGHVKPVQMCKSKQIFNSAYSAESFQITSCEDSTENFGLLSSFSQGRKTAT